MTKAIFRVIPLLVLSAIFVVSCDGKEVGNDDRRKTYTIAWSHYTSWETFQYLEESGVLEKWEDKYNVDIDFRLINDYVESVTQYAGGSFDGILAANMEALTVPGVSEVPSKAILVTSYTNGNDGLVARGIDSVLGLRGQRVLLVEYSVSHYLLYRALAKNDLSLKDVRLTNLSESDIDSVYMNEKPPIAIATWNPILVRAKEAPGSKLLFDSSQIPGEIVEFLWVRPTIPPDVSRAIVGAWFEAMATLKGPDTSSKQEMLAVLAKSAGGTVEEFKRQLVTTRFFFTPEEGAEFLGSETLVESMDQMRKFVYAEGLYGPGASQDKIGMRFPRGRTLGNQGKLVFDFDPAFMEEMATSSTP